MRASSAARVIGWGPCTDWQDRTSPHFSEPRNHALQPGGSEYGRYLWVRDRIPPGSRVLDVGCNCGQFAENVTIDLGCEVVGVDVVLDFVLHCQREKAAFGTFLHADFGKLPPHVVATLGTFDVVTALEVIEHPVDIRGFRDNVQAVLRPGGRLIITTPHPLGFLGWDDFHADAHPCHVRMWTRWRLCQVFGPAAEWGEIWRDECGRLLSLGAVFVKPEE